MSDRPEVPSMAEFLRLVERVKALEKIKVVAAGEFPVMTTTTSPVDIPLPKITLDPGATVAAIVTGRNNVPNQKPFPVHLMIADSKTLKVWFEPPPGPYDNNAMGGIQYIMVQVPRSDHH